MSLSFRDEGVLRGIGALPDDEVRPATVEITGRVGDWVGLERADVVVAIPASISPEYYEGSPPPQAIRVSQPGVIRDGEGAEQLSAHHTVIGIHEQQGRQLGPRSPTVRHEAKLVQEECPGQDRRATADGPASL